MFGNYCLVGNFCKGFIFVFFVNRKLFAKIKTEIFFAHWEQMMFQAGTTSNFVAVLTPIQACQLVCLWWLLLKSIGKSESMLNNKSLDWYQFAAIGFWKDNSKFFISKCLRVRLIIMTCTVEPLLEPISLFFIASCPYLRGFWYILIRHNTV